MCGVFIGTSRKALVYRSSAIVTISAAGRTTKSPRWKMPSSPSIRIASA
jgi:hypothetical protein